MKKTAMLAVIIFILMLPCSVFAASAEKYNLSAGTGKITAYLVENEVYVRPVDAAIAYSNTSLCFDVAEKNDVNIFTLRKNFSGEEEKFRCKSSYDNVATGEISFQVNGINATAKLPCVKIEDNNFIKFKDLGKIVGFNYTWNKTTGKIDVQKNAVSAVGVGNMGIASGNYINLVSDLLYSAVQSDDNVRVLFKSADIAKLLTKTNYRFTDSFSAKSSEIARNMGFVPNSVQFSFAQAISRDLDPDKPMVALTFDDGPKKGNTEQILEALEAVDGRATFFMVGTNVANYPESVQAIAEQGSELANHSYDHPQLTKLGIDGAMEQINKTNALINNATGITPTLGRPPYGSINSEIIEASGMDWYNWNLDTLDWKYRNADTVYNTVIENIGDKDVVLMHDIHATTVEAAVRIIPKLDEMGYQLVTISEMAEFVDGAENVAGYIDE